MKKICAIGVAAALLLCSALTAFADSFITLNGFSFHRNADGDAVIYEYDGADAAVEIPAQLLGADVVEVADYAFFGCETLQAVSFDRAERLGRIGDSAFYGCTALERVSLPARAEVDFAAFQNCTALRELTFSDGFAHIAAQTFSGCTSLEEVTLPDSVTSIDAYAFSGCTSLKTVTIPASVTSIDDTAFYHDAQLTIRCSRDSAAFLYAQAHGIPCEVTDSFALGDVNRDGMVNIMDATAVQRILAELEREPDNGGSLADVDGDGVVNIGDATLIQMYAAQMLDAFPAA